MTVATFAALHRANDGFTMSEAFWMTICSTVVSTITNFTLIWDFVKTPNFAKAGGSVLVCLHLFYPSTHPRPGSGITLRQRSLVIITMIFLTYIALGALISSLMMSLTFVNGLFFTIVTTLTIGFGDIVPVTAAQRFVVCLYAVFGIIILSAGIRLTSEAVLEGLQVGYRRRIREYKRRRRARKREREEVRRWRVAIEERLVERGLEVWTQDNPAASSQHVVRPATLRRGSNIVAQAMYLNTDALPHNELEAAAREAGVPPDKFIGRKFGRRARQNRALHNHDHRDRDDQQDQHQHQHQHHHHHHHHHHHQQSQTSQQQQQQPQPSKEGERRGRVPLDFTWTIDDGGMQERTNGQWGGAWWDRARQVLHLENADGTSRPQEDSNGGMTYQQMAKTLEKEERRSLYVKVRYSLLEDALVRVKESLMSDGSCVVSVLRLLGCK